MWSLVHSELNTESRSAEWSPLCASAVPSTKSRSRLNMTGMWSVCDKVLVLYVAQILLVLLASPGLTASSLSATSLSALDPSSLQKRSKSRLVLHSIGTPFPHLSSLVGLEISRRSRICTEAPGEGGLRCLCGREAVVQEFPLQFVSI